MKPSIALLLGAAVLGLPGCGSTPERYYTLLPAASRPASAAVAPTRALVIEPVSLPQAEDRTQLVIEVAAHQQAVLEQERWIEPLSTDLQRSLAAQLADSLGDTAVLLAGDRGAAARAPHLYVEVRRFELGFDRGARLEAHWLVLGADKSVLRDGDFARAAPVGTRSYAALVAAQSASVAALAAEIATALRELR